MSTENSSIPEEAIEAAANAISECSGMRFDGFWFRVDELEPEDREYSLTEARAALDAASPYLTDALADAWQSAYEQGVDDQRTSASNPGIAGCFCNSAPCKCLIAPARVNPYRSQP